MSRCRCHWDPPLWVEVLYWLLVTVFSLIAIIGTAYTGRIVWILWLCALLVLSVVMLVYTMYLFATRDKL